MIRRKDGRWMEQITVSGKRVTFYGKTKAEILDKIKSYDERKTRASMFPAVAGEWWDGFVDTIAHTTSRPYVAALHRAQDAFADVPISEITPPMVHARITELVRLGYARKTVATQTMIYNHIFTYAVEHGYCLYNPVRDLKIPDNLPKQKRKAASMQDIETVKKSLDQPFGLYFYMAMYTGLRKGELLALDWSDIDLGRREISVTKSLYHVGNSPHIKPPKTEESVGTVPILDALLPVLSSRRKKRGLVFPDPATGKYITAKRYETLTRQYYDETGVTSTAHQFRHAYATMLFDANVPPEKMQVLLRHAQLSTTMDVYKELRAEKMKTIHEEVYAVDF